MGATERNRGEVMPIARWAASALFISGAAVAWADPVAPAKDTLDEITVTVGKHAENLAKTPLSVAAVSGETMMRQGQTQLDQVMATVGGVKVLEAEDGPTFYIRGIGTGVPPNIGDPAVNLSVDGVYQSRPDFSRAGLYDVSRIEVLRGPQGTLYGRNAMAGAVNIVTNNPRFTDEAMGSIGFGNYNLVQTQGAINVPLNDRIAVRAAFSTEDHDGYLSNGADDAHTQSERLKILFKPTDLVTLLLAADHTHIGGAGEGEIQVVPPAIGTPVGGAGRGDTIASPNPWTSPNPRDAADHSDFWSVRAQLDWDLGFGMMTALPAFRRQTFSCRNCWRSETDQNNFGEERQTTTELRLASPPLSPTIWLAGFYYLRSSTPNNSENLGPGANSFSDASGNQVNQQGQVKFDVTSYAAFGQTTYPILSRLRATGGLRYTVDDKTESAYVSSEVGGVTTITTGIFGSSHSWHSFNYTVGLDYDLTGNSIAYAKLSTGYKSGGFYAGAQPDTYAPEHLTSYELGSKSRLLDNRLEVNADAFLYEYHDIQINYLGYINPTSAGIFGILTANASGARISGAEIEARYLLSATDEVDASVYPLNSKYKTLVITGMFGGTYSGYSLPFAPHRSANLGYQHRFDLGGSGLLRARFDLHYESSSWVTFSEANGTRQPEHTVSNAYLTYDSPNSMWSVACYVKNMANTAVLANAQGGPAGLETADIAPPRTFGLQVSAKFMR
jgi:iron complex outermembrane recepter protein